MARRSPRAIGTAAETAVVRFLREHGFPGADRQPLRGVRDTGDVDVTAGIIAEIKAGAAFLLVAAVERKGRPRNRHVARADTHPPTTTEGRL